MNEVGNMDRDTIIEIVKRLDFFKAFSLQEQKRVVDFRTRVWVFDKGEALIKDGGDETSFFLLLKGSVAVSKGSEIDPFAHLSAGDCFGEMAFLTGIRRTANVVAEEKVIVLKLDRQLLDRFDINIREKLKDKFIEKLVDRLDQMNSAYASRGSSRA